MIGKFSNTYIIEDDSFNFHLHIFDYYFVDSAPVSAPPFGTIPVNPFGNFAGPPPPLYVGGDVSNPVIAPQPAPASFYLIPAAAASLFFLFSYLLLKKNFM